MAEAGVFTPYSTVKPFFQDISAWVAEEEADRITAYTTYDRLYWSDPQSFKLQMRGTFDKPVYLPSARTVVDETAHYLLKGLTIAPENDKDQDLILDLKTFLTREKFYSRFATAKHSGVNRGDWLLHMTADPDKPEGRRLSLVSVDPSSYFPITHPDDPDEIIGVDLVEQFRYKDKDRIKKLRYLKEIGDNGIAIITRTEGIFEIEGWWKGESAKVVAITLKEEALDPEIQDIPVYHFRNKEWQGDPFGSSEVRGFERLSAAINQTISDEELALALEGLGCYATDSPPPVDSSGNEIPWVIAPGYVAELQNGKYFKRVEGIKGVGPFLEHIKMLQDGLFEGSGTFRTSKVDVQLAESGIALAIRFMPTLAKIEQRDLDGVDTLNQLFFQWAIWHKVYEGPDHTGTPILARLGNKLPVNRTEVINELNNMLDRRIITREYYRQEMVRRLGYEFPTDMMKAVIEEERLLAEARVALNPALEEGNQSNNRNRPNESAGTESNSDQE